MRPTAAMVDAAVAAAWTATLATPGRRVLLAEVEGVLAGTADLTVLANAARAGARTRWSRTSWSTELPAAPGWAGRCWTPRALGRAAGCYKVQLSADDPAVFAFHEAAGPRPAARTSTAYLDDSGP